MANINKQLAEKIIKKLKATKIASALMSITKCRTFTEELSPSPVYGMDLAKNWDTITCQTIFTSDQAKQNFWANAL